MNLQDKIKVKSDKLTIWRVYPDGRRELVASDPIPTKKPRKPKFKWSE